MDCTQTSSTSNRARETETERERGGNLEVDVLKKLKMEAGVMEGLGKG